MNIFIKGIDPRLVDYPDFLDSIIGTVPEELLQKVTGATPEPNETELVLHFQFLNLPSRLTCRINKVDWRKQHDVLDRFTEQVTRISKILSGKATVTDLVDLDIEITPELKEWVSTETQRRYHTPIVSAPKRHQLPIGYDQDFMTW